MALDLQTGLPNLPTIPESNGGLLAWAASLTRTLFAMFTTLYTDLLNVKNSAFVETENIAALAVTVDKISNNVTTLLYRVFTTTTLSTLTPTVDTYDMYALTAQAGTLVMANPTGSPVQGNKLIVRVYTTSAQTITWSGTQYRSVIGVALPTTTVAGKIVYFGFIFNIDVTKWDLVALSQEA
jgi:hypothetical protein